MHRPARQLFGKESSQKILRSKLYLAGFLVGYLRLHRYLSVARRFNLSLSVPHTAGHLRRLA